MVGLTGFGGVLPVARHMMVEKRKWVDDRGFTELFTLAQFFPGPNIANLCVIYSRRFVGLGGTCLVVVGLYFFPTAATVFAGLALQRWWDVPAVRQIFGAIMPVASGLMLGTALRLVKGVPKQAGALLVLVVTFVLMAICKLQLWIVVLVCLALAVLVSMRAVEKQAEGE